MSAGPLIRLQERMYFDVQRFVRCSVVDPAPPDLEPGYYMAMVLEGDATGAQWLRFETAAERDEFNEGLYAAVSTAMAITRGVETPTPAAGESFGHDEGGDDLPPHDASDEIRSTSTPSKGDQP